LIKISLLSMASCAILNVKEMGTEWGNTDYKSQPYEAKEFTLNASTFTISGFSSGAFLSSNLMAMYNDNIDGVGVLAGSGPCASSRPVEPGFCDATPPIQNYSTDGYKDTPMYHYQGLADGTVKPEDGEANADWSEHLGANVLKDYIDDFSHTFPISNQFVTDPALGMDVKPCSNGGVINCSVDTVKKMLEHFFGSVQDREPQY